MRLTSTLVVLPNVKVHQHNVDASINLKALMASIAHPDVSPHKSCLTCKAECCMRGNLPCLPPNAPAATSLPQSVITLARYSHLF